MPLPEVLIFDYGNVLEGPLDRAAFESDLTALALEHSFPDGLSLWYHFYVSDAWEMAKRGRMTREAFWEDRLGSLGLHADEECTEFKRRMFQQRGILPEMRVLLSELRPRYRLAVLSNTSRRDFAHYLAERRGFGDTFEAVVSSAEEGFAKPEPEIYHIALSRLNIRPHQALFIDDQPRNTLAAEKLGIPSITFTTPEALRTELIRRGIL